MNSIHDLRAIERVAAAQRGVLSRADLDALLDASPSARAYRLRTLRTEGTLRRFCRGFYVTREFDLPTLGQRIAPDGYVSLGTVLARHRLIGTSPDRQVILAHPGRSREFRGLGVAVVLVQIAPHLDFGHTPTDGVRYADAEKAALDALYFHLRGRRYPFDVFSDVAYDRLDPARLDEWLRRYRNPKFVRFVTSLLADHGVHLDAAR